MVIIPAIDLKDGKAVRLTKGLMDSAKIYSDEPWVLAKRFEEMGAEWLHIVDLNGAFAGEPKNLKQIEKIRKECNLKIELGGGIRDEDTILNYIGMGVSRIILGSIAVTNPNFVKDMADKYPIAVSIDVKDGFVAVSGWSETTQIKATLLVKEFLRCGVEAIICTDISRDGTFLGINIELVEEIKKSSNLFTIASGGLGSQEELISIIKHAKFDGVIVGKAFYENKVDLSEAFRIARESKRF